MDRHTLTRLRVAFTLLGLLLIVPLGMLVRGVQARLEAQRRLRHQIVAERVFDEMERELTALLERERARPSSAYATVDTQAASWAPFVVGYFTRDASGVVLPAGAQLAADRARRVQSAVTAAWQDSALASREAKGARPDAAQAQLGATDALDIAQQAPAEPKQESVLRQLNRGAKRRSGSLQPKETSGSERRKQDPLLGQ